MWLRFLALACLAGAAFAGPYPREGKNECAKECHPSSNSEFDWKVGTSYNYHFLSKNNISYVGGKPQASSIEGTMEYHITSPCQAVLKLRNIRIHQKQTSEEKKDLETKLGKPLVIERNGGKVEHICPSHEESTQSLNIKKALMSSFINSMSDLETPEVTETFDSLGKCKTKYTPTKTNNVLVIKKEVDLHSCTNKHQLLLPFMTTQIHSSLLFQNSSLECTQQIEGRIIKAAECREREIMTPPLKKENTFFELSSTLKVTFLEKKSAEHFLFKEDMLREDLLYGIEETRKGDDTEKEVRKILKEMCPKNIHVVDIGVSKNFIKLCKLEKSLNLEQLQGIFRDLKHGGSICSSKKVRDLFIDTLPMIASEPAVKLMVELIENQDVTGLKAKLWPASLALIQNPTKTMIAATLPLVRRNYSPSVMLGVSAMIYRVCSKEDCKKVEPVNQIVSMLNEYIGEDCAVDDEEKALSALKAYGNMGYHGEAHKNIVACLKDTSKDIRLRLAAIDSFRRFNGKRPDELTEVYSNKDEEPEIRISAFSAVAKHVDHEQLQKIKETVESETCHQVGSYVSSFVKNMKNTTCPTKQRTKKLLQNLQAPEFDHIGNSKNIEISGFNKAMKSGAEMDTDMIYSDDSKIPRSIRSRISVYMFGKPYNLFELGFRAEGIEKILEKLMGLKDSLPKEDSQKEKSWELLSSKHFMRDTDAAMAMFLRVREYELLDISGSDLLGIGEMIRIAEMMNTLAQGRDADFSHSFVFMNSKLIVPSVTGRSYSIDFTGSSSLGLTARSKADILSFPRNTDVQIHFQPSVNIEVSTTVGIQSNKHRPDVKVSSMLHMESDFEAKVYVKDGHVAVASVTLPSENILMAKLSTDIVNIDEDHNETRVYKEMQKKVDHCFRGLHKPLGISACATLEVTKPMVFRSFPYVVPYGNCELTLKKSDTSFSSYEMRVEIPKRSGPLMKYKASLDTPGSKVSRRFAVDLSLKRNKLYKAFSIEFVSPFSTAGANGSFTMEEKFIQALFKSHIDQAPLVSINVTTNKIVSKSRNGFHVYGEWILKDNGPMKLDGSFMAIEGRKRAMNFKLNLTMPDEEPISITGIVKQEGRVKFSSKSDWKLSSQVSVSSPIVDMKIAGELAKNSKQSQTLAANLGIDYRKMKGEEHSIKLSGTSQMSSGKINTDARFETTEYPGANWRLNWATQKESDIGIQNNVALRYGKDPEKNYINLNQVSRVPQSGQGENSASVEIPQFNINCGVSLKHRVEVGETPKIKLDADIRYNQDKHVKGLIDVNYKSKAPLEATGKFELEHNGVRYSYEDEIVERNDNEIEGNSKFQYGEGKVMNWRYNYKQLSDDSNIHHEIETTLQTPSSPSPVKSKVALKMNSGSLAIAGNIGPDYSIQAHSNQGETHVHLKHPSVEGELEVNNGEEKKRIIIDMNIKGKQPRHAKGILELEKSEREAGISVEFIPDINDETAPKIVAYTKLQFSESGETYSGSSKFQWLDFVTLAMNETGEVYILGNQTFAVEYIATGLNPIIFKFERNTTEETATNLATLSVDNIDIATMILNGKKKEQGNKCELSVDGSLTSPTGFFGNYKVHISQEETRHRHSTVIKSFITFEKNENVYKAELNSGLQPNGVELKAALETPHQNYEKQSLGFAVQQADDGISSVMSFEIPEGKLISISTEIRKKNHDSTVYIHITTPMEDAKSLEIKAALSNHKRHMTLKSNVFINKQEYTDILVSSNMNSYGKEIEIKGKIFNMRTFQYQPFLITFRRTLSSISTSGNIHLTNNKELSFASDLKKEGDILSTTTTFTIPDKVKDCKIHLSVESQSSKKGLVGYIDANGERKVDTELSFASASQDIELRGRLKSILTPEIAAHAKCEKTEEKFQVFANILRDQHPLFSTSFNRLSHSRGEKVSIQTRNFDETILDVEVSKDKLGYSLEKLSFKARGKFPTISATFSKNHDDPTSVGTELHICQESIQTKCYRMKYHRRCSRSVFNSDNKGFYEKVTMDLEKSVGGSLSEEVGSLQVEVNQDEHDSGSKVILQSKDTKIGCEIKFHKRRNQDDPHSFETHVYLPQRTSRFRALILNSRDRMKFEVDAIPNTEEPNHKFGVEMKREINPETKGISGYVKIDHLTRSEPLLFTCKLEPVDGPFVKGQMLLHYSTTFGKTLTLEVEPNFEQEKNGIRSMVYKLYTQDKSFDSYLKLIREKTRREDKVGFEWKCTSDGKEKRGGAIATLYDKKAGKPKSLKVQYYSPSMNYEVQGTIARAPEDASVSLLSRGQKIKELSIKTSDLCLNIEVKHSGPLMTSSLCLNKPEGDKLQLVKADIYCRRQKCLDACLSIDPHKPDFVSMTLKWEKQDIVRSLRKVTGYDDILQGFSLRSLLRELKEKLSRARRSILSSIKEKISRGIENLKEEISRKLKDLFRWRGEKLDEHLQSSTNIAKSFYKYLVSLIPFDYIKNQVFKPLHEGTICFFHEYVKLIWESIPEAIHLFMEVTKTQFEHCLKKFCVQGTFCHDFFENYQKHGAHGAQDYIQKRISQAKKYLKIRIPSMTLVDLIKLIHSKVSFIKKQLDIIFGQFVGDTIIKKISEYGRNIEGLIRQKLIDALDSLFNHINNIFMGDEDYRIAKSLASDAKRKVENVWSNREEIVKSHLQAVKENIKENAEKIIQEHLQVEKFDPKREVRLSFRQPLGAAEVQILKNELRSLKRKVEEFLE